MVIGYIRSITTEANKSCCIQRSLIETYCNENDLHCDMFLQDTTYKKRSEKDIARVKLLGYQEGYRKEKYYPAWETMLELIVKGRVTIILVDMLSRLYTTRAQYQLFQKLCTKFDVQIIEVIQDSVPISSSATDSVAIYHFSDSNFKKPIIFEKEIDELYTYAAHQKGWAVSGVYIDYTLCKSKQHEHQRFLKDCQKYNVLLTKDFYHINDKMGPFLNEAIYLTQEKEIQFHSLIDGRFKMADDKYLLSLPLKAAIYDNDTYSPEEQSLKIEVFQMFIKYKTNWTLTDVFMEKNRATCNDEYQMLESLIQHKEYFDLVLVDSFSKINYRVSMFFKKRNLLKKTIYSLKEGGLPYGD